MALLKYSKRCEFFGLNRKRGPLGAPQGVFTLKARFIQIQWIGSLKASCTWNRGTYVLSFQKNHFKPFPGISFSLDLLQSVVKFQVV